MIFCLVVVVIVEFHVGSCIVCVFTVGDFRDYYILISGFEEFRVVRVVHQFTQFVVGEFGERFAFCAFDFNQLEEVIFICLRFDYLEHRVVGGYQSFVVEGIFQSFLEGFQGAEVQYLFILVDVVGRIMEDDCES